MLASNIVCRANCEFERMSIAMNDSSHMIDAGNRRIKKAFAIHNNGAQKRKKCRGFNFIRISSCWWSCFHADKTIAWTNQKWCLFSYFISLQCEQNANLLGMHTSVSFFFFLKSNIKEREKKSQQQNFIACSKITSEYNISNGKLRFSGEKTKHILNGF